MLKRSRTAACVHAAFTATLVTLGQPIAAFAQSTPAPSTPSVIPRAEDLAPRPGKTDSDPANLPAQPVLRELQKPEDDIVIDVVRYQLALGAPPRLKAALAELTAPYVGKGKTWEDLVNAKDAVARFLQSELGYYLGYAYIPAQKPEGGVVQIAVLEGRLDQIRLEWDDKLPVNRSVVEKYLSLLQPGSILTVPEVERVVFLINDLRGINARFEIEPGSKPGTATLVVKAQAEPRFAYKVDFDINGSRFIGLQRIGAQVIASSPLGQGDSLSFSALTSFNHGMQFALAGYNSPLGASGLRLGGAVSAVTYVLDKEAFPIGRHGTAQNVNVFGLYPVVRSRNLNLFSLLAFDEKHYDDREDASSSITKKRVRSVTAAVNGDARDTLLSGGVNSYDLNVSGGSVFYNDGRPSGLIDAQNYTKVSASFSRIQNIVTGRLLGYFSLRGQYGFKNLDTTEQFRIGGPDGVRAFANGEGTGDAGFVATTEFRVPITDTYFGPVARETVIAIFADYGLIRFRKDPAQDTTLAGLSNSARYAGVGFALAWVRPTKYALRLSIATPVTGVAKGDTVSRDPRLYLQASTLF